MSVPTRTLNDIITGYEQQGFTADETVNALEKRGIILDDLGDDGGKRKFPVTIGEYIDAVDDKSLSIDLYQRGIINGGNLTDDQFNLALPQMRQDLNEADELLIKDHLQNLASGKYDSWKWDPELKREAKSRDASKALLQSQAPTARMDVIDQYVDGAMANFHLDRVHKDRGRGATTGYERQLNQQLAGERSALPTLTGEEREVAAKMVDARKALDLYGGYAGVTGGVIGGITGAADLMGIRPAAESDEGVISYLKDKTAKGLAYALLNQPSDIDKQRPIKELPQYKQVLSSVTRRRREALNELADITGRDEPFGEDITSL
jgi:hypothetical protein